MPGLFSIVTTIQAPTVAVKQLATKLQSVKGTLLVIGDRKGPASFAVGGCEFLSLARQLQLDFTLARLLPENHYSRKNLGYLMAIAKGANCIYETDDDNAPSEAWGPRHLVTTARKVGGKRSWFNVYRAFCNEIIWPRGFPLDLATQPDSYAIQGDGALAEIAAPIQQGLADGSPDVDAIWRLILAREITFFRAPSVWLPPGTWCPFNSQSTWWWPVAFPLLYLPSYCSFRMTDIWRSFIAQRCLWELGYGVVFHSAEVYQERNYHSLMRDFTDEVDGYLHNRKIVESLIKLQLKPGETDTCENLLTCYEELVAQGVLPKEELDLVQAWVEDLSCCYKRLS